MATTRSANAWQIVWIMMQTMVTMVRSCLPAILKQAIHRLDPSWVDLEITRWSKRLLVAPKIDYQIHNPHQVTLKPGVPYIVMCNHTSHYDIPLSVMAFPNHRIRMLAKRELRKVPIMGKAMEVAMFPFIDRQNRSQAQQDLEIVKHYLQQGIIVWIAPEGTRSRDGTLGSFKKGGFITAIQAKAQIIPIGIDGANRVLPAKTWRFQLHQQVNVRVGQPIDASQYRFDQKDILLQRVRQAITDLSQPAA